MKMKHHSRYILPMLIAALTVMSACVREEGPGPQPESRKVRIYLPSMKAPQNTGTRVAPQESTGISVTYGEPGTYTRALGTGEYSLVEESTISNLGVLPLYSDQSMYEIKYGDFRYYTPTTLTYETYEYVEFDIDPDTVPPAVIAGYNFEGFMAFANRGAYTGNTNDEEEVVKYIYNFEYSSQQEVASSDGMTMISFNPYYNRNVLEELSGDYVYYMNRIPAKLDVRVNVRGGSFGPRVRLRSIQVKNVPKTVALLNGYRTPLPLSGDPDDTSPIVDEQYMHYDPLTNVTDNEENFTRGLRYVWYITPQYDDLYTWNMNYGHTQEELTFEHLPSIANGDDHDFTYQPTCILIDGEYQTISGDNDSWLPFTITVMPGRYDYLGDNKYDFYHDIRPNTWYSITIDINNLYPSNNNDERVVFHFGGN